MKRATKKEKPRHPDLYRAFEQYRELLDYLANTSAKWFGGTSEDYIGTLVLKLNLALHCYRQDGGAAFKTYFLTRWARYVQLSFVKYDSESKGVSCRNKLRQENGTQSLRSDIKVLHTGLPRDNFPEVDGKLLDDAAYSRHSFKPTYDLFEEFTDLFDSPEELWQFCMKGLDTRRVFMLERRFRDGLILDDIGKMVGLTKERVRQILKGSLEKIRVRLCKLRDER